MSDPLMEAREKLLRMQTELEVLGGRPGCETCVHFREHKSVYASEEYEYCAHPVYCELRANLRGGGVELVPNKTPLSIARGESGACGPDALLHDKVRWKLKGRRVAWLREFFAENWWVILYAIGIVAFSVFTMRRVGLIVGPLLALLYLHLTIEWPDKKN